MKKWSGWLRFLHYFRFNPLLGVLLLWDEIRGERKYGLQTTDFIHPDARVVKGPALHDAYSYMPSNYRLLEDAFIILGDKKGNGSFLDIGAGRGRAMIVAAHFGYTNLLGVEVDPRHAETAMELWQRQNFSRVRFELHVTDAAYFKIPDHVETIFFYNPFRETVMQMVVSQLLSSYLRAPRQLYVIYFNPLFVDHFTSAGFHTIATLTRFRYVKGMILSKSP